MLWVGLGGCLGWVWLSVFVVLVWSLVGVFQCRVECYSLGVVQVCLFCGHLWVVLVLVFACLSSQAPRYVCGIDCYWLDVLWEVAAGGQG
jgi:hypothetical protein